MSDKELVLSLQGADTSSGIEPEVISSVWTILTTIPTYTWSTASNNCE